MNEKMYPDNFLNYQLTQCSKQSVQNDPQTYYPFANLSNLNTISTNTNYMDIYNASNLPIPPVNTYQDSDLLNWENRILPQACEKNIKIPDKIEAIEINSKDLSPASYCSNIDLLVNDCYKSDTYFARENHQWYFNQNSCNQKSFELPSCTQTTQPLNKYCNIQKNSDYDFLGKNCAYEAPFQQEDYYRSTSQPLIANEAFMPFGPVISAIDQQTECSNDESDIIVEESDEEITDYSEDHDKSLCYEISKCLICNRIYTPLGTQFYLLTSENPLTMTSQKPVINKIVGIIGKIYSAKNYLCSECLGLINTIDHLQLKLDNFKSELSAKFESTCLKNNLKFDKKPSNSTLKQGYVNKFPKFKCKLCKKVLCLKKYCHYHLKKHNNFGYLCELCGKVCLNRKKFALHVKRHKSMVRLKIDSFKCKNCVKTFRTNSNLKEHENYCLGILPYRCKNQYCDKKFASATKLKNHVKLKHDKKFIAICSICNIGFIKVSDYKSHMITHSTDKKFNCKVCRKGYKTLSNLNFHSKIHDKKLPFICEICQKGFMRKEYLEAHVNNHKGIKNFFCSLCDKKFVSQKNLDSHLKYHEGTVKKNTCNICGKTMTTGFEEHLRVHNNLREFECERCDLKFNTKGTLSKHVKKKHSLEKV